jgi:hypothetical protein
MRPYGYYWIKVPAWQRPEWFVAYYGVEMNGHTHAEPVWYFVGFDVPVVESDLSTYEDAADYVIGPMIPPMVDEKGITDAPN